MSIDLKHCAGCHNNFYNSCHSTTGKCWSRDRGKMVWRIPVGLQESPPYLGKKAKRVPDCWTGEGPYRTIWIDKAVLDSSGYWRR